MRAQSPQWGSPTARALIGAHDVGRLIRWARIERGWRQVDLGRRAGYSASAVSRLETAHRPATDVGMLRLLAAALEMPDAVLGAVLGMTAAADTRVAPVAGNRRRGDEEADAVRRRELLTGALAASTVAIVGAAVPPGRPSAVEDILFDLPGGEPVPLTTLMSRTAAARGALDAARYDDLSRTLPGLLATAEATRDAAGGRAHREASAVLARAYLLASELASKMGSDAAWVAGDRALTAARISGMPVPVGEASRRLAITMRRSGRWSSAVNLLSREAAELDAAEPRSAAVRTSLLLTASYSAATGGDRAGALGLLAEADEDAARHPQVPGNLFTPAATRAQVDVYRIGVHTTLGTPDEGVATAAALDVSRMPTPERRARAHTDIARMWHALGEGQRTYAALRHVEQEAPQEVRRPALRALTADLLYGHTRVRGLREFAVRTGALVGS